MAEEGVIRNFMVALGFKTDNTGLGQMQDAMGGIELKAVALKSALFTLATGAVVAVRQTASELDKLYFSSQRIGASATNITAFGNAISQMGGNAESAIGTLENLAEKMRNSPGYEGMINSLGVNTKQANGEMRDRVDVMKDLSGVLAQMPAYQANAYANSLGIDQNTLLAMRDGKFVSNMEKYQKIQEQLGMNDELTKSGNEFMTEYRDLTMVTKTGFQVIVMQAGKALIPILRLLNQLIQAGISAFSQLNPEIKQMLGVGLRFAMLGLVFGGFIKTFGMIFKFIPMIKSFIGVLKLFRLAFLASPIGIILALATALALLYDDYKTWRDGGKSLFDWSKWTNGIETIINKIKDFLDLLDKIKDKVINFVQKVISDPVGAVQEVVETTKDVLSNVGDELANPTPDENGEVSAPRDAIAYGMDAGFGAIDKGLAFFGDKDAQERVNQRERGEIGYQSLPKIETPKNAKDLANFAENAPQQNKPIAQLPNSVEKPQPNKAQSSQPIKNEKPQNKTAFSDGVKSVTQKGIDAIVNVATIAQNVVTETVSNNKVGKELRLSEQDIIDIMKVASTEVVGSLKGKNFENQAAGVIDTILNRAASGKFGGNSIRSVINYPYAFSDIHSNQKTAYGKVQNVPMSRVSKKMEEFVRSYIKARAEGKNSIIGDATYYVNPNALNPKNMSKNTKKWTTEVVNQGKATGKIFGAGKSVHYHGTPSADVHKSPKPYYISSPDSRGRKVEQVAEYQKVSSSALDFKSIAPPTATSNKSLINSSKIASSNVTINQEYKTDMTINGASNPQASADAVKRTHDNGNILMARNAKTVLV